MLLTAARRRKRSRARYALALCASMALVPILYLLAAGGPSRPGLELTVGGGDTTAPPPLSPSPTWRSPEPIVAEPTGEETTTTTTAVAAETEDVEAEAPSTTTPAAPVTVATTVPRRATTTTTASEAAETATEAPKAPEASETTTTSTSTTVAAPLVRSSLTPAAKPSTTTERGEATWFHAPDGSCAHRTAPIGTVITVTRTNNNATTTCVVDQWGPEAPHRVIDLSMDTFEKLAPPEVGVINVVIEW